MRHTMETDTSPYVQPSLTYPADAVAACLHDELLKAVRAQAHGTGQVLPDNPDEIAMLAIEVDSLTVVEVLCSLDDILPFEVRESVVRAGGYSSIETAVTDLAKSIERQWKEHHGGGKNEQERKIRLTG